MRPGGTTTGTSEHPAASGPSKKRQTVPDTVVGCAYNDRGEADETTDPAGTVAQSTWDDAGRLTKTIENYQSGGPVNSDTNVTTQFTYNADGRTLTITAVNGTTGNQTTTYGYGTTLTDSDIATGDLLVSETYPDSTGGSDQVTYTYNRQGQQKTKQDQNGSVHDYDFDKLGRPTQDRITTLGTGVDGAVRRIGVSYEPRGLVEKVTSYDNATVGSGNIVNEVENAYNSFQQLTTQYQEHGGAVNTSTSPKVQYAYADGMVNTIRQTSVTYPDDRVIDYDYASGDDDRLSRVSAIVDGSTNLAEYTYLGLASVVQVDYTQPDVRYDLVTGGSGTNPYGGLDRFGRVVDLLWQKYSGTPTDLVRLGYGYDRVSNRTWRENSVAGSGFDELYGYDGIHRLEEFNRGDLNAGKTTITSPTLQQSWGLDTTGNWSTFDQTVPGDSSLDLAQGRDHNTVNEITDITETVGASWVTPAHDANGNMTTMPQPAAPTLSFTATYDAWNRLVKLEDGSTTVAEYGYDGQNWRTKKVAASSSPPPAGGSSSSGSSGSSLSGSSGSSSSSLSSSSSSAPGRTTTHFYYSSAWQVLEEREGASTDPRRQFVWGLRYIDDLVLRDRDTTGNGTLNERLYALQDANWNVTAITNAGGAVQERYAYTAYGVSAVLTLSFGIRTASYYDWEYRYTTRRLELDSRLYTYRHRYYHPLVARFTVRDPFSYSASLNLYFYVRSKPLILTDPLGLQPQMAPTREGDESRGLITGGYDLISTDIEQRKLQIRLKTLLLLQLVSIVWLGCYVNQVRIQKAAVQEIITQGGRVYYWREVGSDHDDFPIPRRDVDQSPPRQSSKLVGPDWVDNVVLVDGRFTDINNVSPFSRLRSLKVLWLSQTQVNDVSELAGLRNLVWLTLDHTNVDNILPLEALKRLRRLDLAHTPVRDVSSLSSLNSLEVLSLRDTLVDDISVLASLTNLRELDLAETSVHDVTSLRCLTGLETLSLDDTDIRDVSSLAALKNLHYLGISRSKINDTSDLGRLTGLTDLWLTDNQIKNVAFVVNCTRLNRLSVARTDVTDISALAHLNRLTYLDLSGTRIVDMSAVGHLNKLEYLNVGDTLVSDIGPIVNLTSLTHLHLHNTNVTDVALLRSLKRLKVVGLRGVRNVDMTPRFGLPNSVVIIE